MGIVVVFAGLGADGGGGILILGHLWIWNATMPKPSPKGERPGEQSTPSAVELLPSTLLALFLGRLGPGLQNLAEEWELELLLLVLSSSLRSG